ncbi:SDR family NAD(P)-dependent oxidoreductase [Elioraea rosea]|uniref:SDR family NAD(P)-dependent oxidoreductase n=1 Tax=Elioraea rosea TaxID=2492390 RepID=UPI0013156C6A|nr:SDR family NAD(P)-dependent oxidoreductase [Elioraea rosea]
MSGVCAVLGAGPGVGLAVARRFAREGFAIGLAARSASRLEQEAAALGVPASVAGADLSDPEAVAAALGAIAAALGAPTVLVWNAAGVTPGPAMALSVEAFARDLALSVTGAFAAARAVYPAMRAAGGGTMLFTGGGLALNPGYGAGVASLTAGKSALRGLVHALAGELDGEGIHVGTVTIAGTVAPGTAFDPERIAERFWALHAEPREGWTVEAVVSG